VLMLANHSLSKSLKPTSPLALFAPWDFYRAYLHVRPQGTRLQQRASWMSKQELKGRMIWSRGVLAPF
jgi:hypothetical protein